MSQEEGDEELGSFLPQAEFTSETSQTALFPLVYFLCAAACLLAPLASACSTLLLPCAPPVSQLPLQLPRFTQTCGLFASCAGLATVVAFHTFLFKQREICPLNKSSFLTSLSAGICSQIAFTVYIWSLSPKPIVTLYIFEVCSLLHACFTLTSLYDLRERQVISPSSSLILYKASGLLFLLLGTAAVFLSACGVMRVPRYFVYIVLFGHVAYTGSFYFDLQSLSACLKCSFGAHEIATLRRVCL